MLTKITIALIIVAIGYVLLQTGILLFLLKAWMFMLLMGFFVSMGVLVYAFTR